MSWRRLQNVLKTNKCLLGNVLSTKIIYKKREKTDSFNYRTISLLPIIFKVTERIAHDQTNEFLSGNNIFYDFQSGFRPNHSTNLCLTRLTNKTWKGIDEGMLTGMIFIDIQRAFDTINLKDLLQKLRSYLCDQIFLAETENKLSNFGKISVEFLRVPS